MNDLDLCLEFVYMSTIASHIQRWISRTVGDRGLVQDHQ